MRKVAFLLSSHIGQALGGAELQAEYLARECLARGYQVSYIFFSNGGQIKDDSGIQLYPIRRFNILKKCGFGDCVYRKSVLRVLEGIGPDVIYQRCGSALTGFAAEYCETRKGCRFVWHIASERDVRPPQYRSIRSALFDFADGRLRDYGISKAHYIIGQTQHQDRLLHRHYGRTCDLVAGNWHPVPQERLNKSGPVRVVWIGNIKRIKRPELFIRLAEHLMDEGGSQFVMVGRGGNPAHQRALLKQIAAIPNLEYRGELSTADVSNLLCHSHILVNTSESEGFPNTFVEAWMRKVPVVSLDVDPDGILVRERIGFHSGSMENMVGDLKSLVSNIKLREDMGNKAQNYAFKNHMLGSNVKRVLELFNDSRARVSNCAAVR